MDGWSATGGNTQKQPIPTQTPTPTYFNTPIAFLTPTVGISKITQLPTNTVTPSATVSPFPTSTPTPTPPLLVTQPNPTESADGFDPIDKIATFGQAIWNEFDLLDFNPGPFIPADPDPLTLFEGIPQVEAARPYVYVIVTMINLTNNLFDLAASLNPMYPLLNQPVPRP